jgi:hypothetical protein
MLAGRGVKVKLKLRSSLLRNLNQHNTPDAQSCWLTTEDTPPLTHPTQEKSHPTAYDSALLVELRVVPTSDVREEPAVVWSSPSAISDGGRCLS